MDNLNNIVSQPKLLLFDVNIFKADNIKKVCESLGISVYNYNSSRRNKNNN